MKFHSFALFILVGISTRSEAFTSSNVGAEPRSRCSYPTFKSKFAYLSNVNHQQHNDIIRLFMGGGDRARSEKIFEDMMGDDWR